MATLTPPKAGFDPYVYPPRNFVDAWRMQKLLAVQAFGNDVRAEAYASKEKQDPRALPVTSFKTAIRIGTWWAKAMEGANLDDKKIIFDPRASLKRVLEAIKHSAADAGLITLGVIDYAKASVSERSLLPEDTYQVWHELEDLSTRMNAARVAPRNSALIWDSVLESIEELPATLRNAVKSVANAGGEVVIWASRTLGEAIIESLKPAARAVASSAFIPVGLGVLAFGWLLTRRR